MNEKPVPCTVVHPIFPVNGVVSVDDTVLVALEVWLALMEELALEENDDKPVPETVLVAEVVAEADTEEVTVEVAESEPVVVADDNAVILPVVEAEDDTVEESVVTLQAKSDPAAKSSIAICNDCETWVHFVMSSSCRPPPETHSSVPARLSSLPL